MRRAVVILEVSQEWVQSMAPAAHWLDFLKDRIAAGIARRGTVLEIYEDSHEQKVRATVVIGVYESWIHSMDPSTEWLGFLAGRVTRGIGAVGTVIDIYEV